MTNSFTLTWTLDAPPAEVFRAWTDPAHLGWFFNPEQPIPDDPIEVDLRIGGVWRQRMVLDEQTAYDMVPCPGTCLTSTRNDSTTAPSSQSHSRMMVRGRS